MTQNQKTPSRAETRHQLARAKCRAKQIGKLSLFRFTHESEEDHEKTIRAFMEHHYRNRKACSCHLCRNPRRSIHHKGKEKLTMQERRAFQTSPEYYHANELPSP